jgi:hypothetical protein
MCPDGPTGVAPRCRYRGDASKTYAHMHRSERATDQKAQHSHCSALLSMRPRVPTASTLFSDTILLAFRHYDADATQGRMGHGGRDAQLHKASKSRRVRLPRTCTARSPGGTRTGSQTWPRAGTKSENAGERTFEHRHTRGSASLKTVPASSKPLGKKSTATPAPACTNGAGPVPASAPTQQQTAAASSSSIKWQQYHPKP